MFLIIGVLIIFLGFAFSALAAEFCADLKINQPDRSYEFKYYAQGSFYRLEKLTDEDRILLMADRKFDITWILNPEDYQKEKSPIEKAQEKAAARPVLTGIEESIAPVGRRLKTGAALKVKVDPDKSVQIVIKNQIKEKSTYKIIPFKEGLPIEDKIIHSDLTGQRKKSERSFGEQLKLDEVLIEVKEGLVSVLVTKEYSSFDEVERKEYFVMEKSGQGLFARENRKFIVTLTGDSQDSEGSPVTIKFYKGQYSDLLNEEDFNLPNGEIKKWEFNPGKIQTLEVLIGESGGVKLLSEQYPAVSKKSLRILSKDEIKGLVQNLIHHELDKVKALLDSGVDVNMNISSTDSLLMGVCRYSDSEMVKLLLTYNPDVNYQDQYGNNALTLAVANFGNYKEMIPLLLEAGADPNSKVGSSGQINSTALGKITSQALNNKNEEDYRIIEMFLSHGANANLTAKTGTTPLMQAAYKGDVRVVKLFLEYGADPNLKDKQGSTALDMAKKKQHQEAIDLLQ